MTALLDIAALAVVVAYAAGACVLTALGLHSFGLALVRLLLPARPLPAREAEASWPSVVVQLPVYDEPSALVARALDAALDLDYPGAVEIQLLDDSPPASRRANAALCAARRGQKHAVGHLPREAREGFKAGALAAGLRQTNAPLAAVFDVDFRPAPDLLRTLVAPLLADDRLAFVQAPWAHGETDTWLARAQAAVLDVHFAVDQAGRDRAGGPVLFNGSGGVWRVAAIEDAGGWRADTLAEDLDLTVRVYARGWRSRLTERAEAPADLPDTTAAWRRQQSRWAKGLAEVGILHLGTIWRSRLGLGSKLAFTGHLALSLSFPASFAVVLLHPVVSALSVVGLVRGDVLGALAVGYLALAGLVVAHVVALRVRHPASWRRRAVRILAALSFPVGLLIPAGRAVAEAVLGRRTPFVRTPKDGVRRGEAGRGEVALAVYSALGLALVVGVGAWGAAVFQFLLTLATMTAALAVRYQPPARRAIPAEPARAAA